MEELISLVSQYIINVIMGFESGMYKTIARTQPERLETLACDDQPFITIFRDAHEKYYTTTFNSIIKKDDTYVVATFNNFAKVCEHSKQCLLNILANLTVSIHFNLDRPELDITSYEKYMASLKSEILKKLSIIQLKKLFDHVCYGPKDHELVLIPPGGKFIDINLSTSVNGVKTPLETPKS